MTELKELVRKAKEAVEDSEEPLKTEGFKTILSNLIEQNNPSKFEPKKNKENKSISPLRGSKDSEVEEICSKINRTEFQEIYRLKIALHQSLYILKISRDNAGVGGLLPLQISKILNMIFKIKVTSSAINMALGGAGAVVDRKPVSVQGGTGYKYFIMHAGEEHLKEVLKNGFDK